METSQIQQLTASVEGFLSQNGKNLREGEVLYHLAAHCRLGAVVEIGSWQGKSTIWLGKGVEQGAKNPIYAIDPHTGSNEHRQGGKTVWTFDNFQKNIASAGVDSYVHPLVKPSIEGASDVKEPVGFVFIDGAHEYEYVNQDLKAWYPKVAKGGVIAFHDSFLGWPGVRRVVHRDLFRSHQFKKVRYINAITYGVKVEKNGWQDRIGNWGAYLVKRLHEASLKFPQPFKSLVKHLVWQPCQQRWLRELETGAYY